MEQAATPTVPRGRLRRRLLAVVLGAGVLPALLWWGVSQAIIERFLAISFEPQQQLLEQIDADVANGGSGSSSEGALRAAQLNLTQAELVRRTLERRMPWVFALLLSLSAGLAALVARSTGRALMRRVDDLVEGMGRIARGERVAVPEGGGAPRDEMDVLVGELNRLGTELEAQRQRAQAAEQIAAWQGMARALAHDLKNPLTAMKMAVARLGRRDEGTPQQQSERAREATQLLGEEIGVLARMAESFSDFAKLPPPLPQQVDLPRLLTEVCGLYQTSSPVQITVRAASDVPGVRADPDQLRRAFGNLIKNAVEASGSSTAPVVVELTSSPRNVVAVITNGGPRMRAVVDAESLLRGLDSTKHGGAGMGLPITLKIIHDHGGSLRLEPGEAFGARAIVELPASQRVETR